MFTWFHGYHDFSCLLIVNTATNDLFELSSTWTMLCWGQIFTTPWNSSLVGHLRSTIWLHPNRRSSMPHSCAVLACLHDYSSFQTSVWCSKLKGKQAILFSGQYDIPVVYDLSWTYTCFCYSLIVHMAWYVVYRGKKPRLYETWAKCHAQVTGFPNCCYKSFSNKEEAIASYKEFSGNANECMVTEVLTKPPMMAVSKTPCLFVVCMVQSILVVLLLMIIVVGSKKCLWWLWIVIGSCEGPTYELEDLRHKCYDVILFLVFIMVVTLPKLYLGVLAPSTMRPTKQATMHLFILQNYPWGQPNTTIVIRYASQSCNQTQLAEWFHLEWHDTGQQLHPGWLGQEQPFTPFLFLSHIQ